jgi:Anion-transporting ATPase
MASALERKLIVVTGKGGVGKTTVSAAIGLLAARRGLRTIVVEVAGGDAAGTARLSALLGHLEPPPHGVESDLRDGLLWGLSIDRDRVLAEWLRAIGGRVPARVLTSSSSFQYLIAAAPGAREMLSMVKVWELAQSRRPIDRSADRRRRGGSAAVGAGDYDLVVFDAPATGHALAMLRSPQTFGTVARVGPIARQAGQVRELLEDPARSAYLAVTQATEMGVSETLDLREGLRRELGRELHAVVVNGTLTRRFESSELQRIAALGGAPAGGRAVRARSEAANTSEGGSPPNASGRATTDRVTNGSGSTGAEAREAAAAGGDAAMRSAVRAAHTVHRRAHTQQAQIARLRRGARAQGSTPVLRVPFLFQPELDLEAVQRIADRLERGL